MPIKNRPFPDLTATKVLDDGQAAAAQPAQTLDLQALMQRLRRFSAERKWGPYQSPKNLAMAMVVEAAELLEIFQWMTPEQSCNIQDRADVQQHLGEEIADVLVYLVQIADRCGVDIPSAVDRKIRLNALKYPVPGDLKPAPDQPSPSEP